ncbi:MAG: tyrosine--tRNA ligase [Actinomycetota bacterium]|nr:tyrosine--tRNA ligase [Actinomycetota bacterium]
MGGPGTDLTGELEWRGMVHQVTSPDLGDRLRSESTPGYVGFDATADSLHVGSLLPLIGLQRLQRAGHPPVAILGGGTSLIGDPSGKQSERPLLSVEQIRANAEGIRRQVEGFLDFGTGPAQARLLDNYDWLGSMPLTTFLRDVGKHFSVNVMMTKDSVRSRLAEREQGISYTEFSYVLLQAYDFLHLFEDHGVRLQMGGSDQWGNITAGVDLIRRIHGAEVYGLTWPLMTKADGTKFGKTEQGNVWLDSARTSPYQFFQFWVRTDDRDVGRFLRLLTAVDREQIDELEAEVARAPERRRAQQVLAWEVTAAVHGPAEAHAAKATAEALYRGDLASMSERALLDAFSEAPSTSVPRADLGDGQLTVGALLTRTGLEPSRSAAQRTVAQGGAYVNNRRETDADRVVGEDDLLAGSYLVLRKGKREYHLVRFG